MFNNTSETHHLVDTSGNIHPVRDHLHLISSAVEFMDLVLSTNDLCFKFVTSPTGHLVKRPTLLTRHFRFLRRYSQLFDPRRSFNPALSLFFEEYRKHEIQNFDGFGLHPNSSQSVEAREVFDDFVMQLRARAVSVNLRKSIADWKSKFKSNKKRALFIESELFELFSRLVVIRLDLEYKVATFTPKEIADYEHHSERELMDLQDETYWSGDDISVPIPMKGRVGFEVVQRDRKRLFANMKGKPSLFQHLVGYVSRIECTPLTGYHLHLVLFFDGAEVRKHQWLAQQIGEYWNEQITKGRGRFENCNMRWKEGHPHYGIGIIHRDDAVKRANLQERVLPYLCKDEQHVEVLPYKGCNLFSANLWGCAKVKRQRRDRRLMLSELGKPPGAGPNLHIQDQHFPGSATT